jgi:lipopolysaccharide/colanic/teichoic acid biosynthesis glycosyltransferase/nucleoside-diphosphate-sugar epimerase
MKRDTLKRAFDIAAALCGLIALAPLLSLVALAVWLEDRSSPWFRGVRIGRGERRFRMVKFRTMLPDAWKSGVSSTASGDWRITRVGKILRRAKLDELPQLWNVLAGDMSLVGPRPQVEPDAALYTAEERRLFTVRPGMTDLASIVFADEGEILAGCADPDLHYNQSIRPWKSRLALLYLDRQSFSTDRQILALTLLAAVSRRKALAGVLGVLDCWGADPMLRRMAARGEPLMAWPPPGANGIVAEYGAQTSPLAIPIARRSRDIRLEDLLGRPEARWEGNDLQEHLSGRIVLVTGAGGSIGSELCRHIARYHPKALIGFDQAESALYQVEQELGERFPALEFLPAVGSIQNRRRLEELFQEHRPQSVYHAAAYKHVPLMEAHLFEAVENNVLGTHNLVRAASEHAAEEFVLVSSDKAVRPAGVMGATKRVAEMICQAESGGAARFLAVRFGNVMESSGSVIPNFRRQIEAGGPMTVTHPDMQRYFMTITEAAELVLQSAAMGRGGEVFVLEMGEPIRILDLARRMILQSGLRPDIDIPIVFSGTRPGEKLHEDIRALEEHTSATRHAQIRVFSGPPPPRIIWRTLEDLGRASGERNAAQVVSCLQKLIPDYVPSAVALRQAQTYSGRAVSA